MRRDVKNISAEEQVEIEIACFYIEAGFKGTLVKKDDDVLIIDWNGNESDEMDTRYILDKKSGTLVMTGNSGHAIACFEHPMDDLDLYTFIADQDHAGLKKKLVCSKSKNGFLTREILTRDVNVIINVNEHCAVTRGEPDSTSLKKDMEQLQTWFEKPAHIKKNEILWDDSIINLLKRSSYEEATDYVWRKDFGKTTEYHYLLWAIGYQMAVEDLFRDMDEFFHGTENDDDNEEV